MPLILGTNSIKDTGYDVANSLRFNDGSSDYLNRTPSSSGNRKTFTFSVWLKRSLSGNSTIFTAGYNQNNVSTLKFDANDKISLFEYDGNTDYAILTNRVFRDFSSWYNIILRVDTTQSTANNRVRLYVNGVQETDVTTNTQPSQNYDGLYNSNIAHYIGRYGWNTNEYFGGYMSEIVFIDGSSLDPTSFGEFDEDSPTIWKPIDVSGLTFGTNGFYLDFENSGSLGADVSGNSNNFTVNNLTSVDQCIDTCTNNYALINGLVKNKSYNDGSLAEGNTYFAPDGRAISVSSIGVTKGKWYAEFKTQDAGALYVGCGLMRGLDALSDGGMSNPIFYDNNPSYAIGYGADGSLQYNTTSASYGSGFSDNNIVGISLDMDNKEMYISVNGTLQNSGDPTSGSSKTGGVTGSTSYNPFDDGDEIFFFVSDFSAGGVGKCFHNYGNPAYSVVGGNTDANGHGNFTYAVPSGYFALCTKNLSEFG